MYTVFQYTLHLYVYAVMSYFYIIKVLYPYKHIRYIHEIAVCITTIINCILSMELVAKESDGIFFNYLTVMIYY